jgi:hypothetical protein
VRRRSPPYKRSLPSGALSSRMVREFLPNSEAPSRCRGRSCGLRDPWPYRSEVYALAPGGRITCRCWAWPLRRQKGPARVSPPFRVWSRAFSVSHFSRMRVNIGGGARRGPALPCMAWRGMARLGLARRGKARIRTREGEGARNTAAALGEKDAPPWPPHRNAPYNRNSPVTSELKKTASRPLRQTRPPPSAARKLRSKFAPDRARGTSQTARANS